MEIPKNESALFKCLNNNYMVHATSSISVSSSTNRFSGAYERFK